MSRKNDNMPTAARNDIAECRSEPIGVDAIRSRIITIRGVQVMLDRDLAELYGVPTKALNQAVKRNMERFPAEFMFALQAGEMSELVTKCDRFKNLKHSDSSSSTTLNCAVLAHPSTASDDASLPTQPAMRRRLRSCWQWCHERCPRIASNRVSGITMR